MSFKPMWYRHWLEEMQLILAISVPISNAYHCSSWTQDQSGRRSSYLLIHFIVTTKKATHMGSHTAESGLENYLVDYLVLICHDIYMARVSAASVSTYVHELFWWQSDSPVTIEGYFSIAIKNSSLALEILHFSKSSLFCLLYKFTHALIDAVKQMQRHGMSSSTQMHHNHIITNVSERDRDIQLSQLVSSC
jgi:hypothetical protein